MTCFFAKNGNVEQHLVSRSERVKYFHSGNFDELIETLFEKLEAFTISKRDEPKRFKNLEKFDFESFCVEEDSFRETEATEGIGKNAPM